MENLGNTVRRILPVFRRCRRILVNIRRRFEQVHRGRTKTSFATQTPYKKLAIAIAGPLFNYLFAFITFFGLFYFVGSYDIPPIVSEVIKESPAEKAGIIKGDKILEINNQKINDWSDISKEVSIAVNDVNLKIET